MFWAIFFSSNHRFMFGSLSLPINGSGQIILFVPIPDENWQFPPANLLIWKKSKIQKTSWMEIVKSRFFKNRELYWSNLPQDSNLGRESFVQKSGVQIPIGEGQMFLSWFLFIFTFSIKNWILTHKILFFIFFYQLNIKQKIEQI